MAKLIYSTPADQRLTDAVTITASAVEDPDMYPVSGLFDSNPAKAFKFGTTTGSLVFDFATSTELDLVSIVHHNLDPGLEVRIQGNASNVWTSPSLNQLIVIPDYEKGRPLWPVNPFKDLSALSNSFRYWRLLFPEANTEEIQLGQLWMGAKNEVVHNIGWGYQEEVERRLIEHETDYGVSTIYDLGTKIKSWSPEIMTSDAGMQAIEEWWDACNGRSLPTLVIVDPTKNDARLVRWTSPSRLIKRDFKNDNKIAFGLREVSRGLVF